MTHSLVEYHLRTERQQWIFVRQQTKALKISDDNTNGSSEASQREISQVKRVGAAMKRNEQKYLMHELLRCAFNRNRATEATKSWISRGEFKKELEGTML